MDPAKIVATGADAKARRGKLFGNYAFRPYWRTTNDGGNQWANPSIENSKENLYFYPGEKIIMRLTVTGTNTMRLDIRAVGEGDATIRHFYTTYRQEGYSPTTPKTFKRIISIDQFLVTADGDRKGTEGKSVLPTKTRLIGGGWEEASLVFANDKMVPFVGKYCVNIRGGDTSPRYDEIFQVKSRNGNGGEILDIIP